MRLSLSLSLEQTTSVKVFTYLFVRVYFHLYMAGMQTNQCSHIIGPEIGCLLILEEWSQNLVVLFIVKLKTPQIVFNKLQQTIVYSKRSSVANEWKILYFCTLHIWNWSTGNNIINRLE